MALSLATMIDSLSWPKAVIDRHTATLFVAGRVSLTRPALASVGVTVVRASKNISN
jgi:hypothetical protein